MRRTVIGLVLAAAAAAVPFAQQATFKSGVSLVTIDVTVLDKDGKPVPGLTADDFRIKLNGKPQPVRALAFLQASIAAPAAAAEAAAASPAPSAPAAPVASVASVATPSADAGYTRRTVSNRDSAETDTPAAAEAAPAVAHEAAAPGSGTGEPRTFVLLVDDLSFGALDGRKLFAAAERFVQRVPASDPVGFAMTSGTVTINPTRNRQAIAAALRKVVGMFNDPRMLDPAGVSFGGKGKPRDQPLGMDESMTIDGGSDAVLLEAIIRECFGGDRSAVAGQSVQALMATVDCARSLDQEARRTATLTKDMRRRQLDTIGAVIAAMKSAPGIRHLVLITNGVPVHRDVIDLDPVIREAARSGVQFSTIMEDPDAVSMQSVVNGEQTSNRRTDTGFNKRAQEDNRMILSGAQTLSDAVGGVFYKVIGDPDTSFARVMDASAAVYRLGVEMPSGLQAGKDITLAASVTRAGLTVRANHVAVKTDDAAPASTPATGAAAAAPAEPAAPTLTGPIPASPEDKLKAALNRSARIADVPLRIAAAVRRSASDPGQVDVSVNVALASNTKAPLTVLVGLVDAANTMRVSKRTVDAAAAPLEFLFPVAPGKYSVRFGAIDAAGAMGTVELPVDAVLRDAGDYKTSDVLTWIVNANRPQLFALEDVPPPAETLYASLELYPSGPMAAAPPAVHWVVTLDGASTPVFELDSAGHPSNNSFRADLAIPYGQLPAGTYTIRAALAGASSKGGVAAVVRKQ